MIYIFKFSYIFAIVSLHHSALHDMFRNNTPAFDRTGLVETLSKYGRVFITSELPLEQELEQYRFPLPPFEMHNALAFASLFFGESATMASESAVLGVPAVFFDTAGRCYTREEEEKYVVFHANSDTAITHLAHLQAKTN